MIKGAFDQPSFSGKFHLNYSIQGWPWPCFCSDGVSAHGIWAGVKSCESNPKELIWLEMLKQIMGFQLTQLLCSPRALNRPYRYHRNTQLGAFCTSGCSSGGFSHPQSWALSSAEVSTHARSCVERGCTSRLSYLFI